LWSAMETKSPGPLLETWSCETSPKSRFNERAALSAALAITLMMAERVAILIRSQSRGSVFGAFDVGRVGGVDHDAGAGADMRRHHYADTVLQLAWLVGGRGGLALHHGIGLDQFHGHGFRQRDRDRRAFIARDRHHHALLEEHGRF